MFIVNGCTCSGSLWDQASVMWIVSEVMLRTDTYMYAVCCEFMWAGHRRVRPERKLFSSLKRIRKWKSDQTSEVNCGLTACCKLVPGILYTGHLALFMFEPYYYSVYLQLISLFTCVLSAANLTICIYLKKIEYPPLCNLLGLNGRNATPYC